MTGYSDILDSVEDARGDQHIQDDDDGHTDRERDAGYDCTDYEGIELLLRGGVGVTHAVTIPHDVGAPREDCAMGTGELLDFERAWPRHSGAKENAIIDVLGMKPAVYYSRLHREAASIDGQAHDPITAHRVLRRTLRVA